MLPPAQATEAGVAELVPPRRKLHDVTIVTRKTYRCARVEGVPPEEFGVERKARSLRTCGYCFHEVLRRESELIAQGYDAAQIRSLPSHTTTETSEREARDTVDESRGAAGDESVNTANREIKVTEHYVRMDYEGSGKARLYRVTTGGGDGEILLRDGEEDIAEVDVMPFAAMTPVIITHRFFGRSIADLVMDIQRIKTALLRGALDNLYLHNNPRVEVAEAYASECTLDDLLVSRPGGIVRTKQPGGLNWQVVPDITGSIYPALQYFDATREWRTGVSRQGQGLNPDALQNQVATIANQMLDAAQAKTRLIARIFAETGIRDLFALLHGIIRKHGSQIQTVKLRNQWVQVDPREWKQRDDMTINVALGTGSKDQQLAQLQLVIAAQEKGIAAGLVSAKNLYNSAKELIKLVGRPNPEAFFTPPGRSPDPKDPTSAPIQPPTNPETGILEKQAEIEKLQAQADIATTHQKMQAEIARDDRKAAQDSQQSREQHEMRMAELRLGLLKRFAGQAGNPAQQDGPEGGEASQPKASDIDRLMTLLAQTMAPKPRRRRIVGPSGKTFEIFEE